MKDEDYIELFAQICGGYDKKGLELNTLLSLVNFKPCERLIDIGAGVGRLAIPISKYINVTAIDTNKILLDQIRDPNIEVVNMGIEDFYPEQKYDYGLLVWPSADDYKILFKNVIENVLKSDGRLLVIKSTDHDLRRLTKQFFPEIFEKGKNLLKILPDFFKIEKERIIETEHEYLSLDEALRLIRFAEEAYYGKKLNLEQTEGVKEFLNERERDGKIYIHSTLKVSVNKPKG